ncbi:MULTISPECIES: major capsid protein [Aeromonas]|uniref:major capsid protein n=1 Tax=Aeromonas TaxID=642 RepID=UPI0012F70169|nr:MULTISPECIES: major capsid protein [Aeromonas]MEE1952223.1 major capsid protein [Aeromonas sp. 43P]
MAGESAGDIGTQLVQAATQAMSGGTAAVVGIGAVVLGITAAVKLLHIVRSAMGR